MIKVNLSVWADHSTLVTGKMVNLLRNGVVSFMQRFWGQRCRSQSTEQTKQEQYVKSNRLNQANALRTQASNQIYLTNWTNFRKDYSFKNKIDSILFTSSKNAWPRVCARFEINLKVAFSFFPSMHSWRHLRVTGKMMHQNILI